MSLILTPLTGLPLIERGASLPELLLAATERAGLRAADQDVFVVCQKVISKAEGRVVDLESVEPSVLARNIAQHWPGKDPRLLELVLRETRRVVRMDRGHLIVETGPGWICANAGVDESNANGQNQAVLLPEDADRSAASLRQALEQATGKQLAVIITDTWGRPWREGILDFAIGVSGFDALLDLRGTTDLQGRKLQHTIYAQADALAAAAGLLMRKDAGVPAVHVRGYSFRAAPGSARDLIRSPDSDLFR